MPTFAKLTKNVNASAYEAFNYYLEKQNRSSYDFWADVDDAIITVTLGKLKHILRQGEKFREKHNMNQPKTFELLRCDFILDENFNLYLMEVRTYFYFHFYSLH
jgi:hypothetical protein